MVLSGIIHQQCAAAVRLLHVWVDFPGILGLRQDLKQVVVGEKVKPVKSVMFPNSRLSATTLCNRSFTNLSCARPRSLNGGDVHYYSPKARRFLVGSLQHNPSWRQK
eukprot:190009-Amphidinium_carterae.1